MHYGRTSCRLSFALKQIDFARSYTLGIINEIDEAAWFTMPPGCPTHVAWQVGHLADGASMASACFVSGGGRKLTPS